MAFEDLLPKNELQALNTKPLDDIKEQPVSVFGDLAEDIDITFGESFTEVAKAVPRGLEYFMGSLANLGRWLVDVNTSEEGDIQYTPLAKLGIPDPVDWLIQKIKPIALKELERSVVLTLKSEIQESAQWWGKAALTGIEAPSEEFQRARQMGWTTAPITKALVATIESTPAFVSAVAAGLITKNPQVGIVMLSGLAAGDVHADLIEKGVDEDVAEKIALLAGAWTGATEQIPFGVMFKGKSASLFTHFLKTGSLEAMQELVENMGHNYFKNFGFKYDPEDPSSIPNALKISWGELMNGWFESLTAGFLLGGMGAVMAGTDTELQDMTDEDIKTTYENITGETAVVNEETGKFDNPILERLMGRVPEGATPADESLTAPLGTRTKTSIEQIIEQKIKDGKSFTPKPNDVATEAEIESGDMPIPNDSSQSMQIEKFADGVQEGGEINPSGNTIFADDTPVVVEGQQLSPEEQRKENLLRSIEILKKTTGDPKSTDDNIQDQLDIVKKLADEKKVKPVKAEEAETLLGLLAEKRATVIERGKPSPRRTQIPGGEAAQMAVQKLIGMLGRAKVVRKQTEKLQKYEKAKRFAKHAKMLRSKVGEEGFFAALRALKGKLPEKMVEFDEQLTLKEWHDLVTSLQFSKKLTPLETTNAYQGLKDLYEGGKPIPPYQVKLLARHFGKDFGQAAESITLKTLTPREKRKRRILGAINVPRAMLASLDLSAFARQGLILGLRHPVIWAEMLADGARSFVNEDFAEQVDTDIHTGKFADKRRRAGLDLTDWRYGFSEKEEMFYGSDVLSVKKIKSKNPLVRVFQEFMNLVPRGLQASERSYVVMLNKLRADVFDYYAGQWEGTHKTSEDYKILASFINHATGRGGGAFLQKNAPMLNAIFFSPRLLVSRVQLVGDTASAFYNFKSNTYSPEVSKVIADHMLTFLGAGMTIMGLAVLAGADVEDDPRSSDFGKIKVGDRRWDVWAGYSQVARLAAQLSTGERKTAGGDIVPLNQLEALGRFLRTKASPPAGLAVDMLAGEETLTGKKLKYDIDSTLDQAYKNLTPLVIQDTIESHKMSGMSGVATSFPMAFLGIGVQAYPPTPGSQLRETKDQYAQQVFGQEWSDLGKETQEILRTYYPAIKQQERQIRLDREDGDFIGYVYEKQLRAGVEVTEKLSKPVQTELQRLQLTVGGLSDNIRNGWHLNEKRFTDYKNQTADILDKVIPTMMADPTYNQMTEGQQVMMIDYLIKETKRSIRQGISNEATMKDLTNILEIRKKQ